MRNFDDDVGTLATCQELGRQAKTFYANRPWEEVEPLAKRVWESQLTTTAWEDVAHRVRLIFREPEA